MALSIRAIELAEQAKGLLEGSRKLEFDRVVEADPDFMQLDGTYKDAYDFSRLCPVTLLAFDGVCFNPENSGIDSGSGFAILFLDEVVGSEGVAIDLMHQRIIHSPAGEEAERDVTDDQQTYLTVFASGLEVVRNGTF